MFDNSHSTFQSPVHSSPEEDRIEVNIELVSNWGHPDLIGLTELQFFNEKRQQIKVPPQNISVHGNKSNTSSLDVLVNGKAKVNFLVI